MKTNNRAIYTSSHRKIYIVAAAFVALIVIVLVLCISSIKNNPTVTELIQVPYLKESLGGNHFFDLTAEVGDKVYDVWKTDTFAEVLDPDSWVETEEKTKTNSMSALFQRPHN